MDVVLVMLHLLKLVVILSAVITAATGFMTCDCSDHTTSWQVIRDVALERGYLVIDCDFMTAQ